MPVSDWRAARYSSNSGHWQTADRQIGRHSCTGNLVSLPAEHERHQRTP
jgi:hypothetical protein